MIKINVELFNGDVWEIDGTHGITLYTEFALGDGGYITLQGEYGTRYIHAEDVKNLVVLYGEG